RTHCLTVQFLRCSLSRNHDWIIDINQIAMPLVVSHVESHNILTRLCVSVNHPGSFAGSAITKSPVPSYNPSAWRGGFGGVARDRGRSGYLSVRRDGNVLLYATSR